MDLFKKFNGTRSEWDRIIINNNGNYRQLFSWGEYKKECGWNVLRYVIKEENKTFHLQILLKKFWLLNFFYLPGGISDKKFGIDIDFKKIFSSLKPFSFKYIRVDSNYKIDKNFRFPKSYLKRPFYRLNSAKSMNHIINKNTNLFSKASSKWKYNLRKSLKDNVNFKIGESISKVDVENLTHEMNKLKKLKRSDDPTDFEKFFRNFDYKTIVCKCYNRNDKIVGFRSALIVNNVAWDYYAAANLDGRKLRVGYLSLYEIMTYCKNNNIKFYNIGAVDEKHNPGVAKFKKDSGGDLYDYVGEWDFSNIYGLPILVNMLMYLFLVFNN